MSPTEAPNRSTQQYAFRVDEMRRYAFQISLAATQHVIRVGRNLGIQHSALGVESVETFKESRRWMVILHGAFEECAKRELLALVVLLCRCIDVRAHEFLVPILMHFHFTYLMSGCSSSSSTDCILLFSTMVKIKAIG